jgi:type I restriction enzyme M protein
VDDALIDRVHRVLTAADLEKITSTYHAWRGESSPENLKLKTENSGVAYADVPGFCFSATTEQIASHGHVLSPGRYVGAEEVEDDGDPFEEKMPRLVADLHAQFSSLLSPWERLRHPDLPPEHCGLADMRKETE